MVALVGDRDDLLAQIEREQQLGGVGNEAYDAHPVTVMPVPSENEIERRLLARAPPRMASSEGPTLIPMTLADQEVEERLAGSEWRREGAAIVREWTFEDFAQAIAFVNRVAEAAEAANHHPDILVHGWNKVRLELSTHSQGGLTEADFGMAARIDPLA